MIVSPQMHAEALSTAVQQQLDDAHEYLQYCRENKDSQNFITLFYYPQEHEWRDENGDICYVPEALVPSYMIELFKAQRSYFYATMYGGSLIIELFYCDEDDPPWEEDK